MYLPSVSGGVLLKFDSGPQFTDYLRRSVAPLIPNDTLRAAGQGVLGRAMSDGEIAGLQASVNAGGSLSTVRWDLAHSAEVEARVNDIYRSVLGRDGDSEGLAGAKGALGGGKSLQELRTATARSPEAAGSIDDVYQQVLGRGVDGGAIGHWQDALDGGRALRDVWWDVAHSGEAWGRCLTCTRKSWAARWTAAAPHTGKIRSATD